MKKFLITVMLIFSVVGMSFALQGKTATNEEIATLKQDILDGKVKVGKTRLKDFRRQYGEAKNITIDDRSIVYDYGDLKINFDKQRLWRDWEYDSFKKQAYTDDIDDLRYDLESKKLIGDNITALKVKKDYGEPTEMMESSEDGEMSIYYYGDIKLTFENIFVVDSVKGKNLEASAAAQMNTTSSNSTNASTSQVK